MFFEKITIFKIFRRRFWKIQKNRNEKQSMLEQKQEHFWNSNKILNKVALDIFNFRLIFLMNNDG